MHKPPHRDRRPTIRDVARESGVAQSTVSNALLGKAHVSAPTRQRVQEASDRLGYRPSPVAQALRHQRSFTVGVLMADIANPSYPEVFRGIEDVLLTASCKIFLCNTDGREDKQLAYMHDLIDRRVDGLILVSQHLDGDGFAALMQRAPSTVTVHRRGGRFPIDYVGLDNRDGIRQAVDHLVALGHQRIAFMRGPTGSTAVIERQQGYRRALAAHGLAVTEALVVPAPYTFEGGRDAAIALMALPEFPTAVIASSDLSAIGAVHAFMAAGRQVPGDISVVGLDNIYLAALPQINLTTIDYAKREVGAAAAHLLLQRIQGTGGAQRPRREIFRMRLVVRGSTAPPAPAAPTTLRPVPGARARQRAPGRSLTAPPLAPIPPRSKSPAPTQGPRHEDP